LVAEYGMTATTANALRSKIRVLGNLKESGAHVTLVTAISTEIVI
jgi:hypothetical protein